MKHNLISRFSLVLTLAAALTATPALAQGKGKGQEKQRAKAAQVTRGESQRPELRRRAEQTQKAREKALKEDYKRRQERLEDEYEARREAIRYDERYDDDRYDDRYGASRAGNGAGKVPPGWCKGKGNPHNTPENCGYHRSGRYDDRYGRDGTYDRNRRYGSYEEEHRDFHLWLDRKYSELASRRPLDIPYQVRIRSEKSAEHRRWHEQMGRQHQ